MSLRIGIFGYGNLAKGVECAVNSSEDMELVAVFTRRNPESVNIKTAGVPVVKAEDATLWKDKIDVMVLCGGSATDLPTQTPDMAKIFNVVDSFDTHAKIPEHFANVDKVAQESGKVAVISVGWDPGMFSIARMYSGAVLPDGEELGKVSSVIENNAANLLEIKKADGEKVLIPNIPVFVEKVSLEEGKIYITPIEGLI